VQGTRSDLGSAEIEVEYDPDEVRPDDLVRRARAAGYDVVLGPGQGSYAERKTAFPDEVDVATISRAGEEVKLEQHLAAGKITVFDFYADWCEPCVIIDQELFSIVTRHGDVAVRKVNVVDWDTPVAARYLSRVPELPYLIVYAPDGRRVASLTGVRVPALRKAIAQARGGKLAEAP
jgi:thiol:disulfide interchange protein